jgi:hypothetical protein
MEIAVHRDGSGVYVRRYAAEINHQLPRDVGVCLPRDAMASFRSTREPIE